VSISREVVRRLGNPVSVKEILGRVPSLGKPPKITQAWFKGQGYTSGNDMIVLATMRKLGIVSSGGEPTDFYDALRGKDRAAVAEHVRSAYRPLFELYPDAQQKDAEALHGLLNTRNECAHPSDFFPDLNDAVGYVSSLVKRVDHLQKKVST